MDAAPLTLAHAHARNAVLETKRSNPVAASEEHDLAAAEFAVAAQSTADSEASRILNLLEQHHKRLGQILKSRHNVPQLSQTNQQSPKSETPSISPDVQPPRLLKTGGRNLSTSITSNLASARGIPSGRQKRSTPISPLVSNQHADGRFTEEKKDDKVTPSAKPSWTPPADVTKDKPIVDTTISDAPFQQFYSTFEGLISKLSAPLAFAGLPLTSPSPPVPPKPVRQLVAEPLQPSVDYSQLISQAALRAVRNDQPGYNPSESFYVVPTTGGTTSYAEIMSRADREQRTFRDHRRNLSNISNDDFVDASSQVLPRSGEAKHNGKTMEELSLENQALKHLSDTLSKRLHVFEMSAQTSSAALAQSIRSLHLSPLSTPENSRGKNKSGTTIAFSPDQITGFPVETKRLNDRITELEEILKKSDARARKKEEENLKLRDMLTKYRDKWENLKAGAKARREKQGDTAKRRDQGSEDEPKSEMN